MSLHSKRKKSLKDKHILQEAEVQARKLEKVDEKALEKKLKANK